ncbi:MAG: serine/threonine-protein kinase [Acidobacteriota bacterium]|nr:serine/threonine-protein kinase [Acidobacteriota bacterium]
MKSENRITLEEILLHALSMTQDDRVSYIETAFLAKPDLTKQALGLLNTNNELDDFLEKPLLEALFDWAVHFQGLPKSIGPYKVLDKLGSGGMGDVYLCYQHEPVKRKVALKLMKDGLTTRESNARFQSEYQALARLSHNNVAHIFDAGLDNQGRPFFTMEFFPGKPITAFCREENLSLRDRVLLMIQVCEGIQHAHQKGIIHRDLKPSNILVCRQGAGVVAKIIDFGIAKAISGLPLGDYTFNTGQGTILGTLAYISPEQTEGPSVDVDTRADIYGLGAVLYELLTGCVPHGQMEALPLDRILVQIREKEPLPPSARVLGESSSPASHPPWGKMLRGELDWITAKALAKARSRRYATAREFAADLERFLLRKPVSAGPPSRLYQLRLFFQRHRAAVMGAFVVLLAVAAGIIATTYSLYRMSKAKNQLARAAEQSQAQADELHALNQVLFRMMAAPNPHVKNPDVKVVEVLAEIEGQIGTLFKSKPNIQLRLIRTLAYSYLDMGLHDKASYQFNNALLRAGTIEGVRRTAVMNALFDLANFHFILQDRVKCEQFLAELESIRHDLGPNDDIQLAHRLELEHQRLSLHLLRERGRYREAIDGYLRLLERQAAVFAPDDFRILDTRSGLGLAYQGMKRYKQAISVHEDLLRVRTEKYGPDHPDVLHTLTHSATTYGGMGDHQRAQEYHRRVLDIRRRKLGENHPDTAQSLHNIGWQLYRLGAYQEAEDYFSRAIERYGNSLGTNHRRTLWARNNLALTLLELGRTEAAVATFREIRATGMAEWGASNSNVIVFGLNLGMALTRKHEFDEAETVLRAVLAAGEGNLGADHFYTLSTRFNLARNDLARGRHLEAADGMQEVLMRLRNTYPDDVATAALWRGYLGFALILLDHRETGEDYLTAGHRVLKVSGGSDLKEIEALFQRAGLALPSP